MWADRRIAQLIRRPEILNHSRLQAAARSALLLPLGERGFGKAHTLGCS